MNLAVSNIAWSPSNRFFAYEILNYFGVKGLEVAPALLFHSAEDKFLPSDIVASDVMNEISAFGLKIVSVQSLLFSVNGASLFEGEAAFNKFQRQILRSIELAGRFSIPNLVFGSPKQRSIPYEMCHNKAENFAADVFRVLGDNAQKVDTVISIEHNPTEYGTNFLNSIEQTVDFVRKVDHPSIKLNLDVGAIYLENQKDNVEQLIHFASDLINHVHISEPFLKSAPENVEEATKVLECLNSIGYEQWVSIEMKPPLGNELDTLESSISKLMKAVKASSISYN